MKSLLQFLPSRKTGVLWMMVAFAAFSVRSAYAQNLTINFGRSDNKAQVLEDNSSKTRIAITYSGAASFDVQTEKGSFTEMVIPGAYSTGSLGMPKLPASKYLMEVPFGAEVSVKVLNYTVSEYKLSDYGITNQLMPNQPSLRKDQSPEDVPFEFDHATYKKDEFVSPELATIEVLGVLRSYRIARLTVSPVSYNPVQGTIRVVNDIELEVIYTGADEALTEYVKSTTYSPYFEPVREKLLNGATKHDYPAHPDLTKYPIKYLIVSDRMFENDLQPFIQWKKKKGFKVIVAYTDVIGTTYTQIQSYVHGQYNAGTPTDPAPTFVLFVGDTPQIPATTGSSSQKMTDLYYGSVDGDMFPEMYYGRFSARNSAQLIPQIEKTLYYEQYQFSDPTYLNKTTLIAGADGTWNPRVGQPTIHYATQNYYNAAHGFTDVYTYLTSYAGCYDPSRIAVGFINYTAHCSETSWGDPSLTQSMVNNFSNQDKYPLAIGNCCLAADFGYAECIGETWMRAPNKGSVVYIGSSPSSYWFEDFYWAVGAFPIVGTNNGYVPTYAETTWGAYDGPFVSNYVSAGGTVMIGNLAVTEVHIQGYPSHSSPLYYWQAYNVLGDPSVVIYHSEGSENTVSHLPILPIGLTTYEVTALPGSYVAISKDGVLHGSALVGASGVVDVPIEPVLSGGDVDIVVTKPQYRPYMVQVPAAALVGPYIVLDSYVINDASGNNNGLADYGENISLNVTVKNVGADPSGPLTVSVAGTNQYVTLTSAATQNFPAVASGSTATVNNAFSFSIANFVPDQHIAAFQLNITDGSATWTSNLRITLQAPVLAINQAIEVLDTGGNGNGILDPGESGVLKVTVKNNGNSAIQNISVTMVSANPMLVISTPTATHPAIAAQSQAVLEFAVSADPTSPIGNPANLTLTAEGGPQNLYTATQNSVVVIGLIPEYNMSNGSATTCVGKFYDSGGPNGQYGNNESFTFTFNPFSPGAMIRATFNSFDLENNYDKLFIYNGPDANAPQLPGSPFTGTTSPGIVTAQNASGSLTFKFTSDGSVTKEGWYADISCYEPNTPPNCATNPIPTNNATNVSVAAVLSWTAADATSFDVYFGISPEPPFVGNVTVNQYQANLQTNTTYFWKVVPKNQIGPATGCQVWTFTTGGPEYLMTNSTVTASNGTFYDSGGANGQYQNNENLTMTFMPTQPGSPLKFTFTAFDTENNYDKLWIYNGPDVNAPQFPGSPFMGTVSPGTITSTHSTGAVTFRFVSDNSITRAGWVANFVTMGPLGVNPAAYPPQICLGNSALLNAHASGGNGNYTYTWSPTTGLSNPTIANPVATPTETTTYTVTVNDGLVQTNGQVTLTVNTIQPVDLGQDTTLCVWQSVTFDATIPNAASYLWTPGNITTPTFTAAGSQFGAGTHNVSVTVTDVNGCTTTDNVNVTFDVCSFIGENDNQLQVMIHPNPAVNVLNIQITGQAEKLSYYLLNYQGQKVYSKEQVNVNGLYSSQIDLQNLAKGVYYIRLQSGTATTVKKVVVQ
ncbi:MAG: C25 family cysteine peptidase [Bacteroidia bacterium]|nr:C25 family cysteine peptidase [Bacteroidia bacterium]